MLYWCYCWQYKKNITPFTLLGTNEPILARHCSKSSPTLFYSNILIILFYYSKNPIICTIFKNYIIYTRAILKKAHVITFWKKQTRRTAQWNSWSHLFFWDLVLSYTVVLLSVDIVAACMIADFRFQFILWSMELLYRVSKYQLR